MTIDPDNGNRATCSRFGREARGRKHSLHGLIGFKAEIVYAGLDRAYLVDEASAQILSWNPETRPSCRSACCA